jgi:hypothetical protein
MLQPPPAPIPVAPARFTPSISPLVNGGRVAPERLQPDRLATERFAVYRSALLRSAPDMLAPDRSALLRFLA